MNIEVSPLTHCRGCDRPSLCDIILPNSAPCRMNRGCGNPPLLEFRATYAEYIAAMGDVFDLSGVA